MEIDLNSLEHRHAHDLITSSVVPRPIAWVSTINAKGETNLAPFSFFTGVSWSPPMLAFSVVNMADGTTKDTLKNIREIPEFVIHTVPVDLLYAMESTAKPIPYGTDESAIEGIHLLPSKKIRPYRIEEAKVSFECALDRIVATGDGPNAGNLIIGKVLLAHFHDGLLINGMEADWRRLDALGRLSGNRYCNIKDVIESEIN